MLYEQLILDEWNPSVYLTAYIPDAITSTQVNLDPAMQDAHAQLRSAVLICPGGGYLGFNEQEMEPAALQFLAAGYCVFVLHYSIGAGQATLPGPIAELSKAIGLIRSKAQHWAINPEQLYVCGFSTGAHLALLQAEVCQTDWLSQMTGLTSVKMRPNGLILGYPLVDLVAFETHLAENLPAQLPLINMINTALYANPEPSHDVLSKWDYNAHLSSEVPPVLLWAFNQDRLLPSDTLELVSEQFYSQGIKCESHCFEGGPHGSGLSFNGSLTERARFMEAVLNFVQPVQLPTR